MGVIFHKKKKYGGTGVKVQSDASATSLNPLDVPNGQTIESWAKNPTIVSSTSIPITTDVNMRFVLYSNGTKSVEVASNTLSNALIQKAAGTIPTAYRPIDSSTSKYFIGGTSAYETNGTRMIALTSSGGINVYKSANAGLFLAAYYT